jgi:hypothetical protein
MSFGRKLSSAMKALQAAGVPLANLRPVELHKRVADKLVELGHDPCEIPSRWTIERHLRLLMADTPRSDCTLCTSTNALADGISDSTQDPTTEGHDEMHLSDHRSMREIGSSVRTWHQVVPWDHGIDEVLDPAYLNPNYLAFREGDRIELQASDFSWMAQFLVVSVNRSARTVSTLLTQPPVFLLRSRDRSEIYLVDQFQKAESAFQKAEMKRDEYEARMAVLQSLRDHGRYPSAWLAEKLMQLHRALDAGRLTRQQHHNAEQGLREVIDDAQMDEVCSLVLELTSGAKIKPSRGTTEAQAGSALPEKPSKGMGKPTLVPPTPTA